MYRNRHTGECPVGQPRPRVDHGCIAYILRQKWVEVIFPYGAGISASRPMDGAKSPPVVPVLPNGGAHVVGKTHQNPHGCALFNWVVSAIPADGHGLGWEGKRKGREVGRRSGKGYPPLHLAETAAPVAVVGRHGRAADPGWQRNVGRDCKAACSWQGQLAG